MVDDKRMCDVLYICNAVCECYQIHCLHKTPHKCPSANVPCNFPNGVEGAKCVKYDIAININSKHAQELLNVISMAAVEGIEYDFTEDLAKKLGDFIDGGV